MTIGIAEAVCKHLSEEGSEFLSVYFEEEGFVIKQVLTEDEKLQAYRLRHSIFCGELKWVLQSTNGMESDEYDDSAVFFGVFDANGKLVSFLRLILPNRQFMMERVFLSLVHPTHSIRKEADTAEISRLCVAPEVRNSHGEGNFDVHKISLLLFKAVYQWCKLNGIRYLYAVTELKVYRLYRLKGFPYRMIGSPTKMPDGVTVVAVMMDWAEFELLNRANRPELLKWFKQSQLSPHPRQSQLHEPCLKHLVFV
jgi:N-acyl amino acid synthase of PEP-CTERM/exosortase system